MNQQKPKMPPTWRKYRGRITGLLASFIFALLWTTIGFSEALLIVIIAAIGFTAGAYLDGGLDLDKWLRFFMR